MSFRAALNHSKAVSRDTTLSTLSSTRREDPVATTRRHSSYFTFAYHSFGFGFACRELYYVKVVELVLLVINYVVDLIMCVNYIGVV
jgi:hypothetical protein